MRHVAQRKPTWYQVMFERIFAPLDGTEHAERALPVATRIARATGGTD